MPHLIIESSLDLSKEVVKELHQTVGRQETVSLASVKTRLYQPTVSITGDQTQQDHTALTLKLFPGRSLELKQQMANNLLEKAGELITNGAISVDVIDLGVYKKPILKNQP